MTFPFSYATIITVAGVAELADAPDLGSGGYTVGVQVPSPAPNKNYYFDTVSIETVVLIFLLKTLVKSILFHFPVEMSVTL